MRNAAFPKVQLSRHNGGLALTINGKRHLPLIMAFARTHYMARNEPNLDYETDVVYDQMRRVYDAGIRIFQPCMPEIGWGQGLPGLRPDLPLLRDLPRLRTNITPVARAFGAALTKRPLVRYSILDFRCS